ncbi:MAG: hypothetical protein MUD03_17110 [Pirellula sp.]|nr:hypothetical protein [Pirellula sp.]
MRLDKNGDGKLSMEEMRPDPSAMPNLMGRLGGGEGPGPGGPQGGPALLARMFEGRDTNKDGKLSGDEIPEPMRGRLDRIDQNGDGAISRDEVERAAEMMRDRAGGPGAGRRPERDGDEGPVRPRRPEGDGR